MGVRGKVVAITPEYDTKGKRDATRAFIPEAKRFTKYWHTHHFVHGGNSGSEATMHFLDNRKPNVDRRRQTVAILRANEGLKHLAIFAHGWRTGIQFGFRLKHTKALARAIARVAIDDAPIISLYACLNAQGAAGGDGGFADELRDALCRVGLDQCRVDAHSTRGHTTRNPNLRRFEGEGSPTGGQGGSYVVRPRSTLWRAWKAALRDREDPLRYRVGQLSVGEIHGILGANV